jgi:mono/diheme cytochrome c family protein
MSMGQRLAMAGGAFLIVAAAALAWFMGAGDRTADAQELALGRALYAAHCASCHGPNLEGEPDWQVPLPDGGMLAPPLDATGHAPHHDQSQLFQIVKEGMASANGGKPTDMPAFEGVLSDGEISAVLAFIRSHW